MLVILKCILLTSLLSVTRLHHTNDQALANAGSSAKHPIRWAIAKKSSLRVDGRSNINRFTCDIQGYYEPDTIFCGNDGSNKSQVILKGSLEMDVFKFDCHSRMLTKDLRKTLKADSHPKLVIRFLSLQRIPVFDGNIDVVKGWVNIEMAGTSKNFEILYSFIKPGASSILLNGGRTFHFSDFKLKPPAKLGGIIQIKDAFEVNFTLTLDPV